MLMGPYLSYLLKKLSVKGEKVGVVGSRCSSNSFTEYYVCNFLTLWHVYLKAYQYRFNIVSTAASNLVRLSFSLEQMMAGESACKASKASVKALSLVVTCAFLARSELTNCLWSMTT